MVIPSEKNKDGGILDKYVGKKVKVGIRPEDISQATDKGVNTYETEPGFIRNDGL